MKPRDCEGSCLRIELNKLVVIYFEECFRGLSVLGEGEGLLKPQLPIEIAGAGEIRDADGDMCDSSEVCWLYLRQPKRGK